MIASVCILPLEGRGSDACWSAVVTAPGPLQFDGWIAAIVVALLYLSLIRSDGACCACLQCDKARSQSR